MKKIQKILDKYLDFRISFRFEEKKPFINELNDTSINKFGRFNDKYEGGSRTGFLQNILLELGVSLGPTIVLKFKDDYEIFICSNRINITYSKGRIKRFAFESTFDEIMDTEAGPLLNRSTPPKYEDLRAIDESLKMFIIGQILSKDSIPKINSTFVIFSIKYKTNFENHNNYYNQLKEESKYNYQLEKCSIKITEDGNKYYIRSLDKPLIFGSSEYVKDFDLSTSLNEILTKNFNTINEILKELRL